jgi:hypothetical protein
MKPEARNPVTPSIHYLLHICTNVQMTIFYYPENAAESLLADKTNENKGLVLLSLFIIMNQVIN